MKFNKPWHFLISIQIAFIAVLFPVTASAVTSLSGETAVSFVINTYSGGLQIAVPVSASFDALTSPSDATAVSSTLPLITVTDTRRGNGIVWVTTSTASNLTSGSNILASSTFTYKSGTITKTGGTGVFVAHDQLALNAAVQVVTATGIIGNHVASWAPTLSFNVPALQPAGTYLGTITHSVS